MNLDNKLLLSFAFGLCVLFVYCYFQLHKRKKDVEKTCIVPRAGGALPIIGHLHLLGGGQLTHKTLATMAEKYGPVFLIRLGCQDALVVNNWEMARECFTKHDRVFSDRPRIAASKLLGYNYAMFGFAPYGSYWREMRKMVTLELLSTRRIDMLKHIRASEVMALIQGLYNTWLKNGKEKVCLLVDMKKWFGDLTHNAALRMVGGKRFFGANADCEEKEARKCQKVLRDFVHMFGVFVLSDAFPFLGWFDLQGHEKAMKRTAKELDTLVTGWLEQHRMRRRESGLEDKKEQNFMDVMLNIFEDDNISDFDVDTIIKSTCLNLIFAGSDTTIVTLTWALSLVVNNPHVLKKVQNELDEHVGKDRHVDESDIKNLEYLQAVVKETLRLYPASPIIGLRSSMEDCVLSNIYHVPAGMRLIVNAWKIQRDESVWPDPHEFRPERFLTSHKETDVKGQNFELIPFGSGRRSCPGIALGLRMVHLALASFLHCYDIVKPSNGDVDMTESPGLTNLRATPLEVYLTPRLPPEVYGVTN